MLMYFRYVVLAGCLAALTFYTNRLVLVGVNSRCGFTFEHYFDVLEFAKKSKFEVIPVGEYQSIRSKPNFILLRHDVDISLHHALKIASLEHQRGFRSTYLILLHSEYYNALSRESAGVIKEIRSLGHEVGLHYDTAFQTNLVDEANLLSSITGEKVKVIAQHNPTVSPQSDHRSKMNFVDAKDIPAQYLSDSVQNWRTGCMCKHVTKADGLQILTHPIWWSETGMTREEIASEFVKLEIDHAYARLDSTREMHAKYLAGLGVGNRG